MKYSIVYTTKTGNTKLLADTIKNNIPCEECIYFGTPAEEALKADVIFVGFWTDKGNCNDDAKKFLKTITNQKVFIFGTAGFGEETSYFEKVLDKVKKNINSNAEIIGTYMCQGKMPMAVKARYEKMKSNPLLPFNVDNMIKNFDKALSHPDENDLDKLVEKVKSVL